MKKLNEKTLKMFGADHFVKHLASFPGPAKRFVPRWFREFPLFFGNNNKFEWQGSKGNNGTFKACIPMFDSMTSGYILPVPMDILVTRDAAGMPRMIWRESSEMVGMVSEHDRSQIPDEMVPDNYDRTPYKFSNYFHIETPPGYAVLFCHPLNRMDLPFHSLSGIVDTDTYAAGVNFPFLLREGFEGIIEAGTPMIQLIPIKKEPWKLDLDKNYDHSKSELTNGPIFAKMFRGYRDHFWTKKEYN